MRLDARRLTLGSRDRRAMLIGAWIVTPLAIGHFAVRPVATAWLTSRAALRSEREMLAREVRAVTELPDDSAALRATDAMLATAAPTLFGGADAVTAAAELARYVSARAAESGLRLEQAETQTRFDSTGVAAPPGDLARAAEGARPDDGLRVAVRARGGILGVHAFLRALENGPKLVRVEQIEIARVATDDSFDGTVTLTATVLGLARRRVIPGFPEVADDEVEITEARVASRPLPNDPFHPGRRLPDDLLAHVMPDTLVPITVAEVKLLGTVVRPGASFALCQLPADAPRIVHVGERLGELTLILLEQGRAVFQTAKGARLELSLSNPRS